MPLEFDDPDNPDDRDSPRRSPRGRFGAPRSPWWRPASKTGRIVLATSAVVVLVAFTTVTVLFKHYLERDARFRIAGSQNIEASGLTEVSRAQMLPVFGEDIGRNVFFVPLTLRRKQLEQIPWVEHATVMRLLPDRIRISVVERQPVAFTRAGQQIGLVDADGVLLTMAPASMAQHHYSFPVVTGIDPGDPAGSRKDRMAVYLRFISELDAGGKHNSEQISEIDLTDPEDARVLMPEQGADVLAHFGEDHFLDRFERYQAHIAEWRQQYPHLASVDLRYDNQVVLQMASGKESSETASADPAAAATPSAGDQSTKPEPAAAAKPATSSAKPAAHASSAKKNNPVQKKKSVAPKRVAQNAGKHAASSTHSAAAPHSAGKKPAAAPAVVAQAG